MREFNVFPLCIHFNGTFVVTMGSHLIMFVVNQLDPFKSEFLFLWLSCVFLDDSIRSAFSRTCICKLLRF
jgi:hypothetical protein